MNGKDYTRVSSGKDMILSDWHWCVFLLLRQTVWLLGWGGEVSCAALASRGHRVLCPKVHRFCGLWVGFAEWGCSDLPWVVWDEADDDGTWERASGWLLRAGGGGQGQGATQVVRRHSWWFFLLMVIAMIVFADDGGEYGSGWWWGYCHLGTMTILVYD